MVTPAKKATAKKAPAKKAGTAKKAVAAPAPPAPPGVKPGHVERSTASDLERLGLTADPLAASSLVLARHVDQADSPSGAAAAARELRMTLAEAKSVVKPVLPAAVPSGDGDGVVPPSRLTQLRKKRREPRAAKT